MKITILKPIGWCVGVSHALQTLYRIINKHRKEEIYLIGWLVHNKILMDELEKMGVIILNDNDKSRLALLKTIKNPQAVIVLSAHGTPQEALSYSSTHFQKVYDLTCPFLQSNFTLIKRLITQGYHVIYYGKRHHPETQAILSLSPYIVLVEDVNGIKEIKWNTNKKYALVNQSTYSEQLVETFKNALLKVNATLRYFDTTCKAMHVRYANIQKLRNTEMLMVIGDEHSNNVNQLVELAKNYKINTVLVNDVQKITIDLFDNINNLVITSGTSVDPKHVQAIVDKIKTIVR